MSPVPSAPSGVSATPGQNQVGVGWTDVAGATGYNVYRSTVLGQRGVLANGKNAQGAFKTRGRLSATGSSFSTLPTYPQYSLVFYDQFATTVGEGTVTSAHVSPFLNTYGATSSRQYKWNAYSDDFLTTAGSQDGTGDHYGVENISVVSGISGANGNAMRLRMHMDSFDGLAWGAAPYPIGYGIGGGENNYLTYGRYEVRARADSNASGWHMAWLLWPLEDDNGAKPWPASGETDFPESGFDEMVSAYMHWYNATDGSQQDGYDSSALWNIWHTYAIEWKPSSCQFFIDGVSIGHSTGSHVVPTPMRWVLQSETAGGRGITQLSTVNVYVDYAAVWTYTG